MNLVNWPGYPYHDTFEGGLFCYIVVKQTEEMDKEQDCVVDVSLSLSRPDVALNSYDLWGKPGRYISYSDLSIMDKQSLPLAAAFFVGSHHQSLFCEYNSYFTVKEEHLNDEGKSLMNLLRTIYKTEPLILTFLDT